LELAAAQFVVEIQEEVDERPTAITITTLFEVKGKEHFMPQATSLH
jgi:hypothetical protein